MATHRLAFVGTSRSGLGHLRRLSNIARMVRRDAPHVACHLVTNAPPDGLSAEDLEAFEGVILCERTGMAQRLAAEAFDMALLDTVQLPGIGAFKGRAVLILRETPRDRLAEFRRDDGRPWDLVALPNPADHWRPDPGPGFARRIEALGWIVRPTGVRRACDRPTGLVVATGGGGTEDTRALLYPLLDEVLAGARRLAGAAVTVRQALGPRAGGECLNGADEVFDPGGALNEVFRAADLVITTAGYNSVLELAGTDTPTLLSAIPRSLDDQEARVRLWGPRLGHGLDPRATESAAAWLADRIDHPRRRPPYDLGPDGAVQAARCIAELLCPIS